MNMPKIPREVLGMPDTTTPQGQLFERLVMAGFNPMKNIMEYEKLHTKLDTEDIEQIVHAIAKHMATWQLWLQHLDKRKEEGHGQ